MTIIKQDARLARQAQLSLLGPDAVLTNADAKLYCGDPSGPTWERLRADGKLPPAIRITDRLLGYRKRDLDAHLDARTEERCDTASHYSLPGKPVRPKAGSPVMGKAAERGSRRYSQTEIAA